MDPLALNIRNPSNHPLALPPQILYKNTHIENDTLTEFSFKKSERYQHLNKIHFQPSRTGIQTGAWLTHKQDPLYDNNTSKYYKKNMFGWCKYIDIKKKHHLIQNNYSQMCQALRSKGIGPEMCIQSVKGFREKILSLSC